METNVLKCRVVSNNPRVYGKVHAGVMVEGRLRSRCDVVSRKRYRTPAYDWMKVTCKRCLNISTEARQEREQSLRHQRAAARILNSRVYLSWADALCQLPGANHIELMKAHMDDLLYVSNNGRRPQYAVFMRMQGESRDAYRERLRDLRERVGVRS